MNIVVWRLNPISNYFRKSDNVFRSVGLSQFFRLWVSFDGGTVVFENRSLIWA